MRDKWNRSSSTLKLTGTELDALVQAAFPGRTVLESTYAEGGLANTNICLRLSGAEDLVRLRIFDRDPQQAEKEYRISSLIATKVPGPQVLFFSSSNPVTGQPYSIMEWIEGTRLETLVSTIGPHEAKQLGLAVGSTLASIHSITFPKAGFFDGDLNVPIGLDMGSRGLLEYAHTCLMEGIGSEHLGPQLTDALVRFISTEAILLDEWTGPPCLTHSDFGGSNILVRRDDSTWKVVAVLDWEFAFSGTPFFDFGNLLRNPLGSLHHFQESVAEGYTTTGGILPTRWREMSLLADLTAWMEFLTRPNAGPELIADARSVIASTIETWKH